MEEIAYWTRSIEGKVEDLSRPSLCENKLAALVQEELVQSFKVETERTVSKLVEALNELKVAIDSNQIKLRQEEADHLTNVDRLTQLLEVEKQRLKGATKADTKLGFERLQAQGDEIKAGLLSQLSSLSDIREGKVTLNRDLGDQLVQARQTRGAYVKEIEEDMLDSFEKTSNDALLAVETHCKTVIREQKLQLEELSAKRLDTIDLVKKLQSTKRIEAEKLNGEIIRAY